MRHQARPLASVLTSFLFLIGSAASGAEREKPATATNAADAAPVTQPATCDGKLAYAAGLDFGAELREMLKADHLTADQAMILRGVIDGLNDLTPLYSREEMQKASQKVEAYAATRRAQARYESDPAFRRLADENLLRSRALLKENGELQGTETLPNGIQVKVLKEGSGPVLATSKCMTVNCEITLADGTLVKSTEPDHPMTCQCSTLLPEVVRAMEGMRVGGKWKIVVPPERAFGLGGKPPLIGPNQALAMTVELVRCQ